MSRTQEIVERMRSVVAGKEVRSEKARQLAEAVRSLGNYRWTGLYDVGDLMVSLIAYSGPGAPAYPTFPVTQGDRKSTRLNSSHGYISYAVFCLKKKKHLP